MKKIAFFCIPAHGHTNPMIPVAAELVRRGNKVRFYSFDEFREKIAASGAEFVSCSSLMPTISEEEEQGLKKVSITEMSMQDIRLTECFTDFLTAEFESFKPDVVYSDSACFWGKLNAWKFDVPLVVSTSTFAFNQMSSQYMKHSPAEITDMMFGLPKISRRLKDLIPLGYKYKSVMSLVASDNGTDSVVYTSKGFQPYSGAFSNHYLFMGPSLMTDKLPDKKKSRPLVYISMGTVINDRPDFYKSCIVALKDLNADVIISCGKTFDIGSLSALPDNIKIHPYVDQLDVLSRTDVFITHCGMNSVSESLYMAAPMVLYPQTGEQQAVARRAAEIGAGEFLKDDSSAGIKAAVSRVLGSDAYAKAAKKCSDEFRACCGTAGAAEFIENAPHKSDAPDPLKALNRECGKYQLIYWLIAAVLFVLVWKLTGLKYVWTVGVPFGVCNGTFSKLVTNHVYKKKYGSLSGLP
ncbi:MAG: glycosyl transferase [Ruminococcus sp.]|nr:glycosyl transferase [Ruminococcus sp.]